MMVFSKTTQLCSKFIRENKRKNPKDRNSKAIEDVQNSVEECFKYFSEIGVCVCHSSYELEETLQVDISVDQNQSVEINQNLQVVWTHLLTQSFKCLSHLSNSENISHKYGLVDWIFSSCIVSLKSHFVRYVGHGVGQFGSTSQ